MRIGKVCFYISLILISLISISQGQAQPHSHSGRSHTHSLPSQGIAHRHGGGAIGNRIGTSLSPTKNNKADNGKDQFRKISWQEAEKILSGNTLILSHKNMCDKKSKSEDKECLAITRGAFRKLQFSSC